MTKDSNVSKIKLYGQPNSPEAYELRDFFNRSVVEFDWIELTCDEDCDRKFGFSSLTNNQDKSTQEYDTEYLFICIGGVPNKERAKDTNLIRDKAGFPLTGSDLLKNGCPDCGKLEREPFCLETSLPGSFAAGDVRHGSIKRVASVVGKGAMAVTFVHKYLQETK